MSWRYDVRSERFVANCGCDVGPDLIDTGTFEAHHTEIYQAELVFVHDRFCAQSEVFYAHSAPKGLPAVDYYGWYGEISYFLTPPGRKFNRHTAVFERVKPTRPVLGGERQGIGAWEIAARYAYTDLEASAISGGSLDQLTLGLSWYPTAYTRVTLNYIADFVENAHGVPFGDGELHVFGIRFQFDF